MGWKKIDREALDDLPESQVSATAEAVHNRR